MQSTDLPLLAAFVLGLLVALNPCQLAISVSALTYEYRSGKGLLDGLTYALGRSVTYTLMGWITMCLIGGGKNITGLQNLLSKAEAAVPYILMALAIFLITRCFRPHHHHDDSCHNSGTIIKRNFGMMIPLSVNSQMGALIPLVFAVSASLPVIIIAWLMKTAVNGAEKISKGFEHFQLWLNVIAAIIFIIIAVLMLLNES